MASPSGYSNLVLGPGVDINDVNPRLLHIVNMVLHRLGKVGTVISGYRSPAHSVAVGGFADDPHTQGRALDIYVGGVPLGQVPGAVAALTAAGLVSGNQPNFYHGRPDPAHVQLGGSPATTGTTGGATPPGGSTPAAATSSAGCLPATLVMFCVGACTIAEVMLHFL